jgi:8-oxo-dGTP diphosphatase
MISNSLPKNFAPEFEVTGCFLIFKGKVLFLQRTKVDDGWEKTWGTPGGKIDDNESLQESTVREVFEETGIIIKKEKLILVEKTYVTYPKAKFIYYIFKYNLSEKPEVKLHLKEHSEYKWLTPKDALKLDLIMDEDYCIKKTFNIANSF